MFLFSSHLFGRGEIFPSHNVRSPFRLPLSCLKSRNSVPLILFDFERLSVEIINRNTTVNELRNFLANRKGFFYKTRNWEQFAILYVEFVILPDFDVLYFLKNIYIYVQFDIFIYFIFDIFIMFVNSYWNPNFAEYVIHLLTFST